MAINIESIPFELFDKRNNKEWQDCLIAIRDMQVGQSFTVKSMPSNLRIVLSSIQVLMNRRYISRKIEGGHRIARIE